MTLPRLVENVKNEKKKDPLSGRAVGLRTGKGSDIGGWRHLTNNFDTYTPTDYSSEESAIKLRF